MAMTEIVSACPGHRPRDLGQLATIAPMRTDTRIRPLNSCSRRDLRWAVCNMLAAREDMLGPERTCIIADQEDRRIACRMYGEPSQLGLL